MVKEQSLGNLNIQDRENSEWARRTERVVSVKKEGVRIFKHTGGPGAAKRLSFFITQHAKFH